jgi:predicted nucleic acid-binding protein
LITYLDTSALVKAYVGEVGSEEVMQLIRVATAVGTSHLSKAEMAAAMAMAARQKIVNVIEAKQAWQEFQADWRTLYKIAVSEIAVDRAASLAWEYGLRGYDAVHLATASLWQEAIGEPVTLATFDLQLWVAGEKVGLSVWPENLGKP